LKIGEGLTNAKYADALGEYKLSLEAVDYVQCLGEEGSRYWVPQNPYPRVCEVNFSVTSPYILQKTPSGTINATTTDLNKFYMYADGTTTFNSYLTNVLVAAQNYNDTTQVKTAMESFIAKYSTLAVAVKSSTLPSGMQKVPGKEVYFIKGDLTLTNADTLFSKPFTIVQLGTNSKTTIRGNVNQNMMLLSEGKIIFDGSENCNETQVVKGIYYAKGGFESTGMEQIKNTRLDHNRCIKGNLHIKGIAIGQGLDGVKNARRSELNYRFYSPS
jgi:hypothetical protein